MFRWIWEVVVVLAATLAVVTNAMLIASNFDVSKQMARQQSEINELHNRVHAYEAYARVVEQKMIELQAEVHFGLSERYPDFIVEE